MTCSGLAQIFCRLILLFLLFVFFSLWSWYYWFSTLQLRKMLDLLVHASQCRSAQCLYHNCRKVKGLFRHGIQCKTRASGGCVLCKRMWYLLQLHARACKESECHVPRCRFVNQPFIKSQSLFLTLVSLSFLLLMISKFDFISGKKKKKKFS